MLAINKAMAARLFCSAQKRLRLVEEDALQPFATLFEDLATDGVIVDEATLLNDMLQATAKELGSNDEDIDETLHCLMDSLSGDCKTADEFWQRCFTPEGNLRIVHTGLGEPA